MSKRLLPARVALLLVGLAAYGWAVGLMVQAAVGLDPWDTFAQGLSTLTGISFGMMTNIIGAVVLLFWIPLRQRPGIGTLLNVLIVGSVAQIAIELVPTPDTLLMQWTLFLGAVVLLALATGLYVGVGLGPGPRDGLMTGLARRLGWPIWFARTLIEGSVLLLGWLLGGHAGWGTIVFAVLIGPLCHVTIPLFERILGNLSPEAGRTHRARRPASRTAPPVPLEVRS